MIVWTVANQKGGVGKTTTVVSLAGILAQRGQRVLLIDTDPHASLTAYLDFDSDRLDGTLYELFQAVKPTAELVNKLTLKTKFENINLLPASITLATLDRVMGNREGMGLVGTAANSGAIRLRADRLPASAGGDDGQRVGCLRSHSGACPDRISGPQGVGADDENIRDHAAFQA